MSPSRDAGRRTWMGDGPIPPLADVRVVRRDPDERSSHVDGRWLYSPYRERIDARSSARYSFMSGIENVTYPGAVCSITWRDISCRR